MKVCILRSTVYVYYDDRQDDYSEVCRNLIVEDDWEEVSEKEFELLKDYINDLNLNGYGGNLRTNYLLITKTENKIQVKDKNLSIQEMILEQKTKALIAEEKKKKRDLSAKNREKKIKEKKEEKEKGFGKSSTINTVSNNENYIS